MKKVLLILTIFLPCYFIYNWTNSHKSYYLAIGDGIARGTNEYGVRAYGYNDFVKDYLYDAGNLEQFNQTFTDNDYRIADIIKILDYSEEKNDEFLGRLIKEADIVSISLGMNEIYYKLDKNNENIFSYIDSLISDYNRILNYVGKFNHEYVFVLGYYNVTGRNNDVFEYANLKLKSLCDKHDFIYIDTSKIMNNNPMYVVNNRSFIPNIRGYEKISQIIVAILEDN